MKERRDIILMKPIKKISSGRVEELLRQQEQREQEKTYTPGKVEVVNSERCKCRVVNFFGDVHTESYSVRVSGDERTVAVGCANGSMRLYDVYKGEVLSIHNTFTTSNYPCTGLRWNPLLPNECLVTANCDGTLKWYRDQNAVAVHFSEQASYLCLDAQPLGAWTVAGTESCQLHILDNQTTKPVTVYPGAQSDELENNLHSNRVFSVKCLPNDPQLFFSCGWDSTIHFWDARVPTHSIRKIAGPSVSADSMDYFQDTILVGNYRNNHIAQLYDFKSGQLIQQLDLKEPPNGTSYCFTAAFAHRSEHDLIAVGLSGTNQVKILRNKEVVSEIKFQATPLSLAFYRFNNKDFLVVGGIEGTIYAIKIKVK